MPDQFNTSYLKESIDLYRYYKRLGESAMEQAPEAALFITLDPESNSIATIVKHLAGNMRSRWTDFLTTDGEKPARNRDGEFEEPAGTRTELMADWESGWKILFETLESLAEADVDREVYIRGEVHSVTQAISRNLTHTTYHIGQIVYLAKHFAGSGWKTLTIPRHASVKKTQ